MDNKDSEFLKRIQKTFRIEAEEHLKFFSAGLIALEKTPTKDIKDGIIENMFRDIHSLKGASRSVGQKQIESVCQPMEDIFSALKRKEIAITPVMIDLFYNTVEILLKLVTSGKCEQLEGGIQSLRELILQKQKIVPQEINSDWAVEYFVQKEILPVETRPDVSSVSEPVIDPVESKPVVDLPKSIRPALAEVVRIPISKLDPLLLQAEEFIQSKIAINQITNEINEVLNNVIDWKTESQKWTRLRSIPTASQWNDWQERSELHLNNLERLLSTISSSLERERYSLGRMVDNHLDVMKQVIMLPVSSLVEVFPVMVREIARDQGKEVDFVIQGADLEIDKRVLEELKDPLIHLIRNSIDHGIGTPEERKLQHKPSSGKITISFTAKESGLVEITVTDDGKGIDKDHVLIAAMKLGILTPEAAQKLTRDEILSLIFNSGLSTRSFITDLSGRGLGLSIVSDKVEKLNGVLSLQTQLKSGTSFGILLPMTLATFRGIAVSQRESMFILPTINVERVLRVKPDEITTVENRETIRVNDDVFSLVSLADALGLTERRNGISGAHSTDSEKSAYILIVVLVSAEKRMAFKVDQVHEEHQVLVKGLGKLLHRVRNISGATVLGTGKIILVLNIADLIRSAVRISGKIREKMQDEVTLTKSGKILVAEDSITSRTLLKNILETAGYQVGTAVDGADAFTRAKSEDYDLIVSDVDMPRMNGFELTTRIRNDKKLGEIPVILVTALESREDKERGIEAGADAYIIKSSFDQGNLLEVIKKLI